MDTEPVFRDAFRALPIWKKGVFILAGIVLSPWIVVVATLVGLSLLPFMLLGTFEGSLGPKPVKREVVRIAHDVTMRAANYFG
jgi:hypothetical protein